MQHDGLTLPIRQPRLRDQVYATLRDLVRSGSFPRDGIVENELASRLKVSRTPVREALFQLCREGVLEDTGRGYRLPELSARDMSEIVELRLMIEPEAAALAVMRCGKADMAAIADEARRESETFRAGDLGGFVAANGRFRERLLRACGNGRLIQLLATLDDQIQALRMSTLAASDNQRVTLAQHRRIVKALRRRDPAEAAAAMRDLLEAARRYYESFVVAGAPETPHPR
jgi:DNA-binding GntR family transcriptional regulator